ncbi:MAG: cation:proton antiporter [Actinobacteria bacterium]|nr:cation:proton antiporter [Actinomycetota bacterium]MBU4301186.1 cation:proton antiporter [Actinomycetota bacterium]
MSDLVSEFFLVVAAILVVNAFLCLYRGAAGPTIQDRIIGINIVNTKAMVVLLILSTFLGEELYLDIALVYALLNFVVTITISRYIET